jgi:mannosyltransferase
MALAALIVVGAVLRFSTLGVQHYWLDEAVTAGLMRMDLGDMLTAAATTESTPPLYYLIARGWAFVFGSGEIALRSLSALLGTLTIPVAYAIGATLASRRAGLVAAALTAVSPPLVWYSQEARSYALLVLLSALSLLFVARALRGGRARDVALWALTAALALLTHYFAGFLVMGEAIWLLLAYPRRREAAFAVAGVAACAAALLPLALHQSRQGNLDFIGQIGLASRVGDAAEVFLAGPTAQRLDIGVAILAVATVVAIALAIRAEARERQSVLALAGLALVGIAIPVLLALAGADYVLARNLLPFWLPLALVVAIGVGAERSGRLGMAAGAVLVAASVWLSLAVPFDRTLQREAITAAIVPGALDAERQRIDPRLSYAVADGERELRVAARCPDGYAVESGGGTLRTGDDQDEADSGRTARGWAASAGRPGNGEILSVYAICVRPLD